MNYYYLVASLPSLQLSAEPPMTRDEFRARAAEQLTAADLRELDALFAGDGRSSFGRAFVRREAALRHALALRRAEVRGRDAESLRESGMEPDLALAAHVADAFAAADPLERERRIDAMRWRWLEEQQERDPFAPTAVFSYALRLDLAQRWSARTEAMGRKDLAEQKARMLSGFDNLEFTMDAATETGA
jgi:Protein of unknown function (DUF2764)